MTSPFAKKRSGDDEAKAAQLLRWVEQYEGSGMYTLASRFFEADREKAIRALAESAGTPVWTVDGAHGNIANLVEYLRAEAGQGAGPVGQVMVGQVWFDPPAPDPDREVTLVWDEKNEGPVATGPYKAMVHFDGVDLAEMDIASLEPGGTAQRRKSLGPVRAGAHHATVYSPWHGSRNSTVVSQAGGTSDGEASIAVGQAARQDSDRERQLTDIRTALAEVEGHLRMVTASAEQFDLSEINYALQKMAHVAPSLNEDLQSQAARVLGTNPDTVDETRRSRASALARDALVAAQTADARVEVDAANPVDNPAVIQAAQALLAVADTITNPA